MCMNKKSVFIIASIVLLGALLYILIPQPSIDLFRICEKVEGNYLWGFIDKTGRNVIPPQFLDVYQFSDGLAAVRTDSGWGFINTSGNFVIQPQLKSASWFREGLADVSFDGHTWGYVELLIKKENL